MVNILRSLCQGKNDEYTHKQFVRYGCGEYRRFLITLKKGRDLKVKTSFDLATDLVGIIAQKAKEPVSITGKIVGSQDLKELFQEEETSKWGKQYTIDITKTLNPLELRSFFEKCKLYNLLININGTDVKLTTKQTLPKPGKDNIPDNFCSATFPLSFLDEFAFDFPTTEFKVANIVHLLQIEDIIIPEQYKNDFTLARFHAIRKGKLIREITIDGKTIRKEYPLKV